MVNTREIAAELRLSHWAGIMRERTQGGLSIKAFCRQIGICQNTYFYWQRRVRAAACQDLVIKPQNESATVETGKALVPSGWAQLTDVIETVPVLASLLTVEVGGCHITVNDDTDPTLLAKVCGVLRAL